MRKRPKKEIPVRTAQSLLPATSSKESAARNVMNSALSGHLAARLVEYEEAAQTSRANNEELRVALERSENDAVVVVDYLQNELEEQRRQVEALRASIQRQKEEGMQEQKRVEAEGEASLSVLRSKVAEKEDVARELERELSLYREFKRKRAQYTRELAHIQSAMSDMGSKHKESLSRMDHKFYDEKVRIQKEAEAKINALHSQIKRETWQDLHRDERAILEENRRMASELKESTRRANALSEQLRELEQKNRFLLQETKLQEQSNLESAKRSHQLRKGNEEMKGKVVHLEEVLTKLARDFDAEMDDLRNKQEEEIEELTSKSAGLKKLLTLKAKEFYRIQDLAQEVLDQRTDLEQSFLDSLSTIRREVGFERAEKERVKNEDEVWKARVARSASTGQSVLKPDVVLSDTARRTAVAKGVTVHDLSWTDMERVLRLLFGRMNAAAGYEVSDDGIYNDDEEEEEEEEPVVDVLGGAFSMAGRAEIE